jgi:ribosomal protein L29
VAEVEQRDKQISELKKEIYRLRLQNEEQSYAVKNPL